MNEFEMEKGDAALLAKALKAYRPDTSEDELIIDFYLQQFAKMADNELSSQEDPANIWKGAEAPFADNH